MGSSAGRPAPRADRTARHHASLDRALLRFLRTRGHWPPAEGLLAAFSRTGEHGFAWHLVAGAGMALDPKRRPVYRRALIAILGAYVANQTIKLAVRRPRPRLEDLPPLTDTLSELSYPSAHAATSFAAARALSPALPAAVLYPAAAVMALSRPYLGVHYVSDSVAGAALGDAVARLLR